MTPSADITSLLIDWRQGNQDALDQLFARVYDELKEIAHLHLRRERADHTLNTTALVHEVYLKLVDVQRIDWQDRQHFFAVAASAMRRILVSYARQHKAQKRGGGEAPLSLDEGLIAASERADELVALDEALSRLALLNERLARVVELRFFGGLTIDDAAAVMDVSRNTLKRDWQKARAWLYHELRPPAAEA